MLPAPPKDLGDFVPPTSKPKLVVERGGLYVSGERRAARDLDTAFREAAAASKRSTNSKAYPGPAIAALAQSLSTAIARRIYGLLLQNWKGGGSREFGERLGHAILTCNAQLERKYGKPAKTSQHSQHSHDRSADKGAA